MRKLIKSAIFSCLVFLIVLFNLFMIPYLYYSAFSVGISTPIPTDIVPYNAFIQLHQQSQCDQANIGTCCIYLGPIVGKTTSYGSRFLLELTQDIDLKLSVQIITKEPHKRQQTPPMNLVTPVRANTPTIIELNHLFPNTTYTVTFENCQYPLAISQPEGGHALIKTLPTEWTNKMRPKLAVISCNSINIRNREQRILDNSLKPKNFSINEIVNEYLQNNQNVNNLNSNYVHNQKNLQKILTALNDSQTVNYLSQSTELWGSLMLETANLHYLFHLGDQAYMDSNHDGSDNNQFLQSQKLVFDYLTKLWLYKIASNEGNKMTASTIRNKLPPDTPSIDVINASHFSQQFSSLADAFTKHPQQHHRVNNLIPLSIKQKIYELYKQQYIKTFSHAPTRITLSRVANLMIWDDHDVFDDSNDCPADTDILSLRRMIFDIGTAAYHHYQHSLNLDNTIVNNSNDENYYTENDKNQSNSASIKSYSMFYEKKFLTQATNISSTQADTPHSVDLRQQYAPVTDGMHHFHTFDSLCFLFLDTRSGRDPASFNPSMYDIYQSESNPAEPYLLFGKKQWADLELFLSGTAMNQCKALIIANSMPYVFMQSSPNYLVALFHDDMYGHLSSLDFEKEQVRLFNLFTNWRQQQHQSNPRNKAQMLLLGGDVHSSGYSNIYPYLYYNHSLPNAYLYTPHYTASIHDQEVSKVEPLFTLTVSPIQNEGLHISWLIALTGFAHSYPIIINDNDTSSFQNNGAFHTLTSTYYKVMMYLESYFSLVLPSPIFTVYSRFTTLIHKIIKSIFHIVVSVSRYIISRIKREYDDEGYFYTVSGFKHTKDIAKQHKTDRAQQTTSYVSNLPALDQTQLDKYYFGYHHYSWINTNAYAIIEVFPVSEDNNPCNQVVIQSQLVTQARPLREQDIFDVYKSHVRNIDIEYYKPIQMPTQWSRYPKHNTTSIGR